MGNPWILRPAAAEDVDAISRVWHRGWIDGHAGHVPEGLHAHRDLASFRERVPARIQHSEVATIDAAVVGFVSVREDELEELFVLGSARGIGVAAALLDRGEQIISARFPKAWLAVVTGNARARRFYERQGWSDAGPIDYAAQTSSGTFAVPSRRCEKSLR